MDRLVRSTSVAIIVFAIVIAVVVGSRMDQSTVSLLSGAVIGVLIAAPAAALMTFILVRKRSESAQLFERPPRHLGPLPQNPPQYWVLPQQYTTWPDQAVGRNQLNAASASTPAWSMDTGETAYLPRPKRRFYVIGETGEVRDLDDPDSTIANGDGYEFESNASGSVF